MEDYSKETIEELSNRLISLGKIHHVYKEQGALDKWKQDVNLVKEEMLKRYQQGS